MIHTQLHRILLASLAALVAAACGGEARQSGRSGGGLSPDLTPEDVGSADGSGKKKPAGGDAGQTDGDDTATDGDGGDAGEDDQPLTAVRVAAGLRNFEQINATMSTLTGVPASNPTVRQTFNTQLSTSLPTDNDVKAFLGSQQVAIFKLAVEYCDALTRDTTLRAATFPGFDFAATPANALNAAGKQMLAETLVDRFWGTGLSILPPRTETTATVIALIDELLVGKNLNAANVTPVVVTGACTAVLSSAPVSLY